MRIEIRLREDDAKKKGYPYGNFYKYLNGFAPGVKNTCVVLWEVAAETTATGYKYLVFTMDCKKDQ